MKLQYGYLSIIFLLMLYIFKMSIPNKYVIIKKKEQQPIRHHQTRVPINRGIPININTRNVDHYQQLGILYDGNTTLPLLGRRIYSGSSKWNYYTLTNDNIAMKVPLSRNGRDCTEQYGCEELYDDDSIIIPEYNNGKFKIKLYDRSPRYIPF